MIQAKRVYDIDREQFTGYARGYYELGGERVTFITICGAFPKPEGGYLRSWASDEVAAWALFDLGLRAWLKDRPGRVLWRMEPTLQKEEQFVLETFSTQHPQLIPQTRYAVACRIAITENDAFTVDLEAALA